MPGRRSVTGSGDACRRLFLSLFASFPRVTCRTSTSTASSSAPPGSRRWNSDAAPAGAALKLDRQRWQDLRETLALRLDVRGELPGGHRLGNLHRERTETLLDGRILHRPV